MCANQDRNIKSSDMRIRFRFCGFLAEWIWEIEHIIMKINSNWVEWRSFASKEYHSWTHIHQHRTLLNWIFVMSCRFLSFIDSLRVHMEQHSYIIIWLKRIYCLQCCLWFMKFVQMQPVHNTKCLHIQNVTSLNLTVTSAWATAVVDPSAFTAS